MIYLTGATNDRIEARLLELGVGLMLNPGSGYRPERIARYAAYACDNGCFSQGATFDGAKWLRWLERFIPHRQRCLFAVAPDVVGDAEATLERSSPYLPLVREMGLPVAFVAQDGQERLPVPWDAFDCLFVGGTDAFKLSEPAYALVAEAKRRGKWTHQGRVNGWRRFRASMLSGFDSCDGTYIAFNPEELVERVAGWMWRQEHQMTLWDTRSATECVIPNHTTHHRHGVYLPVDDKRIGPRRLRRPSR